MKILSLTPMHCELPLGAKSHTLITSQLCGVKYVEPVMRIDSFPTETKVKEIIGKKKRERTEIGKSQVCI